jgi:DNA-binding NarL/FixJ family response regulator
MSDVPRVLLADEQLTDRRAVRGVLEEDGFDVCAEASDATNAIVAARGERPDLCLIAVLLPGGGIRTAAEIASHDPGAAIVMLAETGSRDHLLDSVRAGAVGYLRKDMDPRRIPAALRGVLRGEAAIPRDLTASLVKEFRARGRRRRVVGKVGAAELTPREWEVAELLEDGVTTGYIAERLMVSPVTVRRHISSVLTKLGVANREEARALLLLSDPGGREA